MINSLDPSALREEGSVIRSKFTNDNLQTILSHSISVHSGNSRNMANTGQASSPYAQGLQSPNQHQHVRSSSAIKASKTMQRVRVLDPAQPSGLAVGNDGVLEVTRDNDDHPMPSPEAFRSDRSTSSSATAVFLHSPGDAAAGVGALSDEEQPEDILHTIAASDIFLPTRDFFVPPHTDSISCVCVDHVTGRIYTSSFDDCVAVWVYSSRERVATLQHADWVNGVAVLHIVSPLGQADTSTEQNTRSSTLKGSTSTGADDAGLVTTPRGEHGSNLRRLNSQLRHERSSLGAANASTRSGASGKGAPAVAVSYIVTACEDGTVTFWSPQTHRVSHQVNISFGPVTRLCVFADGVVCASLRTLSVVLAVTGSVVREHTETSDILCIDTADGQVLAGTADGRIVCWDVADAIVLRELTGHGGLPVSCLLVYEPQGLFFSATDDGTVRQWALANGSVLRVLKAHNDPIRSLAIHSRGNELFLFTGGIDGNIGCHALRARKSGVVHSAVANAMCVWEDPSNASAEAVLIVGDPSGLVQVLPIRNPEANVIAGTCI